MPDIVVLAAGMGSRFGGSKQFASVNGTAPSGGATLLELSVFEAARNGFERAVVVIRPELRAIFDDTIRPRLERFIPVESVEQAIGDAWVRAGRSKPWGTGHAVLAVRPVTRDRWFAVVNADDYYAPSTLHRLHTFASDRTWGMVGYRLDDTLVPTGGVSRAVCRVAPDGRLTDIDEYSNVQRTDSRITGDGPAGVEELPGETLVSMNAWALSPSIFDAIEPILRKTTSAFERGNTEAECHLPAAVRLATSQGTTCRVVAADAEWFGLTTSGDLDRVRARVRRLIESDADYQHLFGRVDA